MLHKAAFGQDRQAPVGWSGSCLELRGTVHHGGALAAQGGRAPVGIVFRAQRRAAACLHAHVLVHAQKYAHVRRYPHASLRDSPDPATESARHAVTAATADPSRKTSSLPSGIKAGMRRRSLASQVTNMSSATDHTISYRWARRSQGNGVGVELGWASVGGEVGIWLGWIEWRGVGWGKSGGEGGWGSSGVPRSHFQPLALS